MRTILAAAALSVLTIVPASAQSCVSNGAFVPCQGGMGMGGGMGGGMAPMGARPAPGMMQPAGQGMSDPMMREPRMERRSSSRRATRTSRKQMKAEDADQ
ncbi:MAG TPA: hypothetical protein VGO82_02465 [Enterovirga sp.]|jgi:hypothetical protein|nr:hypothetical protein [Enterovirga sp.]